PARPVRIFEPADHDILVLPRLHGAVEIGHFATGKVVAPAFDLALDPALAEQRRRALGMGPKGLPVFGGNREHETLHIGHLISPLLLSGCPPDLCFVSTASPPAARRSAPRARRQARARTPGSRAAAQSSLPSMIRAMISSQTGGSMVLSAPNIHSIARALAVGSSGSRPGHFCAMCSTIAPDSNRTSPSSS